MYNFYLVQGRLVILDHERRDTLSLSPDQIEELAHHARRGDPGACTLSDTSVQTVMITRALGGQLEVMKASLSPTRFALSLAPEAREAFAQVLDAALNTQSLPLLRQGQLLALKVHEFNALHRRAA